MGNDRKDMSKRKSDILRYLDELNYSLEPFYHINFERLRDIRRIVNKLERELHEYRPQMQFEIGATDKRVELVGLLPFMLMSRDMFPTHKSLYEFAKSVFGVELRNRLSRPARTRIVGEILKEVMILPRRDWNKILDKLQEIIKNARARAMSSQKRSFFTDWDSAIRRMRHEYKESET